MLIKLKDVEDIDVLWNNLSKTEIILVIEDSQHNNHEIYLSREQANTLADELKKRLE